ncbi:MAG: FMN-binding negative transcriptional regulator [Acidobacteriaceae bacterium]
MYIPRAFVEERLPVLHELIRSQPFCSLVTVGTSGLFASHLPMVLHGDQGSFGVLHGHLSRANTQWRDFNPEVEALAIFSGAHHYISPSWYPEKSEHGKVVPTWNYAVVHAYGNLRTIEKAEWLSNHLRELTSQHESAAAVPWKVTDAPAEFIESMLKGIVGLELTITRLEGKWKVSQNRSERDRRGVIQGLDDLDSPESLAMKNLVSDRL